MNRWRNKSYLIRITQLPSAISGRTPCDAHHTIGHGLGGMGLRSGDQMAFPLTRDEHTELHRIGWKKWEEKHGCQLNHARATRITLNCPVDESGEDIVYYDGGDCV